MTYPTIDEVRAADRMQLCRWWRFLPSPGENYLGTPDFEAKLAAEVTVMNLIGERFDTLGGVTPKIAKALGWKP